MDWDADLLRERLQRLGDVSLRGARLEPAEVLDAVIRNACSLTGAAYGAVTTVNDSGTDREFVTHGSSADQRRRLEAMAGRPRILAHFSGLESPLRVESLPAYLRGLDLPVPLHDAGAFLCFPLRHRGVRLGSCYVIARAGESAFSGDDEELLVVFASQAAALGGARLYEGERRSREELEGSVTLGAEAVRLTATEYRLLAELAGRAGRVLTHEHLLGRVWGPDYAGEHGLVRSFVRKLRSKLNDSPRSPLYVTTVHRVGYRMERGEAPPAAPENGAAPDRSDRTRPLSRDVPAGG